MGSVTTIHQNFYAASLQPITVERVGLASLTIESISDLILTLRNGSRLGVAASYGKKCALKALAFSTETRVLLIVMDGHSGPAHRQKGILKNEILCNILLEKHGFFMERIAAALHLDMGLFIRNAFDISSGGDSRASAAAYRKVLERARTQYPVDVHAVRKAFTERRFDELKLELFALRAWASYVGVQGLPNQPGVIDTSTRDTKASSDFPSCSAVI